MPRGCAAAGGGRAPAADRPFAGDAGDLPRAGPPDGDRPHGHGHRRIGHRQGAGGARAARLRQAPQGTVRGAQHGGDPARADRERAVRPRARRLHRRRAALGRQVRAGLRRHAVPRRDRRHAARGADPPAARAAGRRVHDGRRPHADQGQCAHRRRDPSRPAPADPAGPVPRGPVLSPERRADPPAAAARAARRHSRADQPLPARRDRRRPADQGPVARRHDAAAPASLAGQRARAREPGAPPVGALLRRGHQPRDDRDRAGRRHPRRRSRRPRPTAMPRATSP